MKRQNVIVAKALTGRDVDMMRSAVKLAASDAACTSEDVALIVYDLYQSGLTDIRPLSSAAGMLATSRAFKQRRRAT